MGQLDASIVTLTYRPVEAGFHAGLPSVEWVSLSYLLTLTALLIPVGRWSDRRGRKLSYLQGLVVFAAASAACGLAPSLTALIVARAVQGAGAALLQSNSVALVTTSAPLSRMRAALGVQAAAQALGLALGPTVGGLLVDSAGWRYVYFINVPVGVVAAAAGIWLLPRTRQRVRHSPLDGAGALLLAACSTALILGLSSASGSRIAGGTAILFLAAGGAGWLLVRHERRTAHPLIDPLLLRDRAVSAGLLGAVFGYLTLFGPLLLVPILLEQGGMSAVQAGLVLSFLPAGFALAAAFAGAFLPVGWNNRARCTAGSAIASAALAGGLIVPASIENLAVILGLTGIGLGIFTPANNAQVMGAIPPELSGTGGGMVNMARGLGTSLGIAVVTLCLELSPSGPGHSTAAFAALLGAALVTVASAFLSRGAGPSSLSESVDAPNHRRVDGTTGCIGSDSEQSMKTLPRVGLRGWTSLLWRKRGRGGGAHTRRAGAG
jgi:EmrB/QacA subfamily drug resistance transporter